MKSKQQLPNRRLMGFVLVAACAIVLSGHLRKATAQTNTFPSTGNAGVGTTSPGKLLTVNGDAGITTLYGNSTTQNANDSLKLGPGSNGNFFIDNTGAGGLAQTILEGFNTTKTSGANYLFSVFNNSTDRSLLFSVQSAGTGSGSNQVVFPTGNVGVGTTAPGNKLEVVAATGGDGIRLTGNATGNLSPGFFLFESSTQRGVLGLAEGTGHYSGSAIAGDIVLRADTGKLLLQTGTGTSSLAISSGNVGIGTGTPSYKLDVAGQIRSSTGGFMFPDGTVQLTASPGERSPA